MNSFSADLFDGKGSRPHAVAVHFDATQLYLAGNGLDLVIPLGEIELSPPVGAARSIAYLPNRMELHSADAQAMRDLATALPSRSPERWAQRLEGRLIYALGALVVSIALIFAGLRWGVPLAADIAARAVPQSIDERMGEESLKLFDRFFAASTLPDARQSAIARRVADLCERQACPVHQLHFRDSGRLGANAMALPGGTIIVTDALVEIAEADDEVVAVIAHELGHVQDRHSLRLAIQSIGAGAILVAVTGDLSRVSDLISALPSLLLQSGYSRDMERQADTYAINWLKTACIPPQRFADILMRIDKQAGNTGLLDSHPGSLERIEPFRQAADCSK